MLLMSWPLLFYLLYLYVIEFKWLRFFFFFPEAMWGRSDVLSIEAGIVFVFFLTISREYERDYNNDSWIPTAECTGVSLTQCDITEDISATVPYNLRVRAFTGTQASLWATLNGFFNRVTSKSASPVRKSHNPSTCLNEPSLEPCFVDIGPSNYFKQLRWVGQGFVAAFSDWKWGLKLLLRLWFSLPQWEVSF